MTVWKASAVKPTALFDAINSLKGENYNVPLGEVRGATGLVTTATPADAVWAWVIATNVGYLTTNLADGATKTSTGTFQVQLPETFRNSQSITVKLTVKLLSVTGTGVANNGSDIDILAFKQASFAIGADLCETAAQTFAALDTVYTKEFVIGSGGLAAGDRLNFNMVGRAIENDGGNGTLQVVVEKIEVALGDPS